MSNFTVELDAAPATKYIPSDLVDVDRPNLSRAILNMHLTRGLDWRTYVNGVRRQGSRQLYCHLCGCLFGTSSLRFHVKACSKKVATAQKELPAAKRKRVPAGPQSSSPSANSSDTNFELYNKEALEIFGMLTIPERELLEAMRRDAAAIKLTCFARMVLAKRRVREYRFAQNSRFASMIQRTWRSWRARKQKARALWTLVREWVDARRRRRLQARKNWDIALQLVAKRLKMDAAAELDAYNAELKELEGMVKRQTHPYLLKGGGTSCAEAAHDEWKLRQARLNNRIAELKELIAKTESRIARKYSTSLPQT